jgi:hypothetical protein
MAALLHDGAFKVFMDTEIRFTIAPRAIQRAPEMSFIAMFEPALKRWADNIGIN